MAEPQRFVAKASRQTLWHWWVDELTALVPAKLLDDGSAPTAVVQITIERDCTLVSRRPEPAGEDTADEVHAGGFLASDDGDWRALLGNDSAAPRHVHLVLAAPYVFDTILRLPAAARPYLGEAVRHRLVQESPLPPDKIGYDWALIKRRPDGLDVALAMARNSDLEALAERFERLAVTDYAIGGRGRDGRIFHFGGQRPPAATTRLKVERRLAVSLLALVLAGPLLIDGIARWQTDKAERRTAELRQSLAPDLDRAARQAWARAIMSAIGDVAVRPPTIAYVEAVAASLPPSAWLQQFERGPDRISVAGLADDPPAAVAGLASAALLSPMVLDRSGIDPVSGQSRFEAGFAVPASN